MNAMKHGVHFADAVPVLTDELALTIHEERADEDRRVSLGTDALGRLLVIVYSWTPECIRMISARKATRRERRQYGGGTNEA
jgi:uncharacterized DUF497 family protein